ncbi:Arrestin (or S-antigen), C-terminal domain family protein [Clavispora lusitaniae]|uniref:Arrestin C-terminal-like domain-containing protein n=1 Tax=Clavispora lusitaniae (strain ATCC 42720) TaxID=306902 RepID=C4Y6R8_CLAL4|nr:uncharacterized protein CLUG_03852 [Clavispora lusitaniae ATCC 42720]EEQ39724.1 hypothetical protein CLUG_03852 [Clavispora lusitaniae ATCC 42720]KAF7582303.1 Arrestin (or S-antigen), C-terminal domain family protein [Clavispora lusitaniae]
MTGFSLERLKHKVGRRMSDSSVFDFAPSSEHRNSLSNPSIIVSEPDSAYNRLRASSLSMSNTSTRSRSRSVSKKQAKELIRQETAGVVSKKLLTILHDLGLQQPIALKSTSGLGSTGPTSKSIKIHVSNSNDCLYLAPASSASFTYEDAENGGNDIEEDTDISFTGDNIPESLNGTDETDSDAPANESSSVLDHTNLRPFNSPNYLCTKIDAHTPVPHVFGIIVELMKDICVKNVKVDLSSDVSLLWPTGEGHNRFNVKEKFKIGALEWNLSLQDADYYINTSNSNDTRFSHVSPNDLKRRTRKYKLANVHELAEGTDPINTKKRSLLSFSEPSHDSSSSSSFETHKAGLYVFLLPVLFPSHIPASVTSINGMLAHILNISVSRVSDKLIRRSNVIASYNLPMVRTPPSLANSTADKPIYVNRTWNDALHYVITFPRKYIALGSEHTVNLKLIPLVKDVIIKRIKFNILERITYVSRDMSKEYDYDSEDPFNCRNNRKNKERVVPLCELKTKQKNLSNHQVEPFKEVVIKCPENNLLYSCYEAEDDGDHDPLSKRESADSVMIASPLDINVALPFLTTKGDKEFKSPSYEEPTDLEGRKSFSSQRNSFSRSRAGSVSSTMCPSSPIIGSLETQISHMNGISGDLDEDVLTLQSTEMVPEGSQRNDSYALGYTSASRALAPDSNFRHIQVTHRLQVCFRISKPDQNDNNRMHHYEVVIDTPLILLSARCSEDSTQLPKYDDIEAGFSPPTSREVNFRMPSFNRNGVSIRQLGDDNFEQLPSFEEATSTPASPMMRSVSLGDNALSRVNSLLPLDPAPAYDSLPTPINPSDIGSSLSIDDLVIDTPNANTNIRKSSIKASLQSSFAPVPTTRSDPLSEDSRSTNSKTSSSSNPDGSYTPNIYGPPSINSGSGDDTVSTYSSIHMHVKPDLDTETNDSGGQDSGMIADRESGAGDMSTDDACEHSGNSSANEAESIITHDTNFGQRIPLLTNESVDSVAISTAQCTDHDLAKASTDTLNRDTRPVDMYHV